jgi:ferredoxin
MKIQEVEIEFGDGREGIVPVGTYLIDAARRLGAVSDLECSEEDGHDCKITITEGGDLLSPISDDEREKLSAAGEGKNVRLACFAKIEKSGVITAMVDKKKKPVDETKDETEREETYRKEFTELPLEKKIAELAHLEMIALGETFAFVINSPFKIFDKIGDVMAEFGFKKEEEQKRKARPGESKENGASKASGKKSEGQNEAAA